MTGIFVTGYKGNIGSRLINLGYEPLECDITSETAVSRAISREKPIIIVHLAGITDVNFCQDDKNKEDVIQTNFRGSGNIFKHAAIYGAKVVYISSDHVFDGRWFGNYSEKSTMNPKNYYGVSKVYVEALSEAYDNVNIIRTSTLFWGNRPMVQNPMITIANGKEVNSPVFMLRSFMHIDHFVTQLQDYCLRIDTMPKFLHLSGSKTVSWYKFIHAYATYNSLDTSNLKPRYWDIANGKVAPRPHRAGLNTSLSKKYGFDQFDYLDGIRYAIQL